jgi:hypothetical protein
VADGAGGLSIPLGDGKGGFHLAAEYRAGYGTSLAAADFNGDGKPDLAASENTVRGPGGGLHGGGFLLLYLMAFTIRFWKSCTSVTSSARTVGSGLCLTTAPSSVMVFCRLSKAFFRTSLHYCTVKFCFVVI